MNENKKTFTLPVADLLVGDSVVCDDSQVRRIVGLRDWESDNGAVVRAEFADATHAWYWLDSSVMVSNP